MQSNGRRNRADETQVPADPSRAQRDEQAEPTGRPGPDPGGRDEHGAAPPRGRRSAILRATPTADVAEPQPHDPRPPAEPERRGTDAPGQHRAAIPGQRRPATEPQPAAAPWGRPPSTGERGGVTEPQEHHEQEGEQERPKPRAMLEGTGDRGSEGPPARPTGRRLPHVSWTTVAVGVVALLVALWVVRGVTGGSSTPASPSAGAKAGHAVTVPHPHKPTMKAVRLNGNAIASAGPVLTINPALAQPGGTMSLSGTGFDAHSLVDVTLSIKGAKTGTAVDTTKTDKNGGFSAQAQVPENLRAGSVLLTAHQRNSDNVATAEAVTASGVGTATLSKTTGQPGKSVSVTARGFMPGETIKVYWGRAAGVPTATLKADQGGGLSQAPVQVGVGGVGATTLVLVGAKSGTTATVPFYRLGLYPSAGAHPYALKAGEDLSISGSGFAPDEPVLVYVNASSGPPAMTAHSDSQGNLGGIGFTVPFGLRGPQNLVLVGEKSRASVSSGFDVLPYSPTVQPSTYGGSPGTTFSFFAKGFAADEVVLVYLGRSKDSAGELVSAFRVDGQGAAGAAGSYQITSADQGTLTFTLIGRDSGGRTTTSVKVSPGSAPAQVPTSAPYTLPPNLRR